MRKDGFKNRLKQKAAKLLRLVLVPPAAKRKTIAFFKAFGGQFACNPKYILLKLREKAPDIKAFFLISEKHGAADALPEYARPVRYRSLRHAMLEFRCNVFVTNGVFDTGRWGCSARFADIIRRKRLTISTWHGTPLKTIGADMPGERHDRDLLSDFLVAGCRHTAAIFSTCFSRKPFPVSLTGTPRCDILVNGADVAALKEKLGLPRGKKIFLFAPTFRYRSGSNPMEALDVPHVLGALSERFGGEWAFVCRMHDIDIEREKRAPDAPDVINGNIGDDMMEYLACADALMTDYSSSMFDYALTRRPCFLFALDREHYEKEERGFCLDYDALPFPFADSCGALLANIRGFDDAAYAAGVAGLLEDIGDVEDGKASERIADCILHYISTGEKRLETVDGVDTR